MSVFFFSFLKHFLEFRFPVIVDFAVSMLSLFRNITYNGNWFLGKPDSALKSHVLASTTSGPESYRVLKSKERHQNYLLEQKNNRVLRNVDPIVYLSNTNFISEYEKFVSRLLYSDIQQIIDVSVQNVVEQQYLNFIRQSRTEGISLHCQIFFLQSFKQLFICEFKRSEALF